MPIRAGSMRLSSGLKRSRLGASPAKASGPRSLIVNSECVPAVDDDWLLIDPVHAARREEEVSQKPVECADEVRKPQNRLKCLLAATVRELVDGRISKRQHSKAAIASEGDGNRANPRDDRSGLSRPGTGLHKSASRVLRNGPLFRRQVHASLIFTMASRM